jgi:hypothetical protein
MRLDVRPVARLRGQDPVDLTGAIAGVVDALRASSADLSSTRVVFDWIQYQANFREVADLRPVLAGAPPGDAGQTALEIAIDLRRSAAADLRAVVAGLLADHEQAHHAQTQQAQAQHAQTPHSRTQQPAAAQLALEPWGPATASCIWRFNALYWQALSAWEQSTGREYEQALPGGASDARNTEAVRELILELFKVWDDLDARGALPPELYVVELGVGNGGQARAWLDEFSALSSAHSRDYYRRLHYLMGDYSPHVLGRARQAVAHHGEHVTALVVDATHPGVSLGFLRGKTFLVYISNVYDNLPTDELARIDGRSYQVEVRAVIAAPQASRLARAFSATSTSVPDLISKLLRLGPELLCEAMPKHFPTPARAVEFWREAWAALRLQERYVPTGGLDLYQIGPDLTGEMLRTQLESAGDIRVHVNNGAVASFADTLPLLHPFGRLHCHDLFVTDVRDYLAGFHGPGKYDGSVVNWVNGPLLRHVANRAGYEVRIAPFAQRPSANIRTLTATVRE